MSAKDEIRELYMKKFGANSAKRLDSINATNDRAFVEAALASLTNTIGETTAKKFLHTQIEKYMR